MDVQTTGSELVFALQRELQGIHPSKQITLPLRHFFAHGVYVREIRMPKGACVVGHIHRHEHVAIMSQGDMSVYDETGLQRMKAPYTFVSRAATKRALYIHEDVIFTTIHRMSDPNERDLVSLHYEFVAVTPGEFAEALEERLTVSDLPYLPSLITEDTPAFILDHPKRMPI